MISNMSHQYICKKCNQVYSQVEFQEERFCRECGSFLQPNILPRGKKYWIFQANPETFRIFNWWEDHPDDDSIIWSIRQYADEVRKGDIGVLWLSGNSSGIYAIVKVSTNPRKIDHTDEEKKYWTDSRELFKITKRAILEYTWKFFDQPISRLICLNDDILSGMSILRQAQGTVFKFSESQMKRIYNFARERERTER